MVYDLRHVLLLLEQSLVALRQRCKLSLVHPLPVARRLSHHVPRRGMTRAKVTRFRRREVLREVGHSRIVEVAPLRGEALVDRLPLVVSHLLQVLADLGGSHSSEVLKDHVVILHLNPLLEQCRQSAERLLVAWSDAHDRRHVGPPLLAKRRLKGVATHGQVAESTGSGMTGRANLKLRIVVGHVPLVGVDRTGFVTRKRLLSLVWIVVSLPHLVHSTQKVHVALGRHVEGLVPLVPSLCCSTLHTALGYLFGQVIQCQVKHLVAVPVLLVMPRLELLSHLELLNGTIRTSIVGGSPLLKGALRW